MGSSGNGAAQAALNKQAGDQSQLQSLIQKINAQFSSPDQVASNQNYVNSVENAYKTGLTSQQQTASRNLNFANARSGLTGGSEAADSNAQLQKSYVNGLLSASQAAQQAGSSLVASQNAQKDSLIGLAGAGGTTGQIGSALAGSNASNLASANSNSAAANLGDVFQSTANMYTTEQAQAAARAAQYSPWGNPYGFNG